MDISTDIDKAVVFSQAGVLASNMGEQAQKSAVRQAQELVRLAEARAAEMGSQPFTQLAVDTGSGYVFVSRELGSDGLHSAGHRQEGQPGRPGFVRLEDVPARCGWRAGGSGGQRSEEEGGIVKIKPVFKVFGLVTLLGSLVAGAYYFLFVRTRKPQVEMYFDDGSMLSMPGDTPEAAPFLAVAAEVLTNNPVTG